MKIRPILLSKSTVFSRSKICIFSRSDPRFGVTIWSDKVSSISLKFDYSRGKRLSLSIQKEFLKLIDTEQSYSALLAHNFERQFSFDIFITHTDNCPFIPRIGLLRYTAHRLKFTENNAYSGLIKKMVYRTRLWVFFCALKAKLVCRTFSGKSNFLTDQFFRCFSQLK